MPAVQCTYTVRLSDSSACSCGYSGRRGQRGAWRVDGCRSFFSGQRPRILYAAQRRVHGVPTAALLALLHLRSARPPRAPAR